MKKTLTLSPSPTRRGKKSIDLVIGRIAHLQEKLLPVTDMGAVEEFTAKKVREHLRELTAIVGEMAMDVKELMDGR